MCLNLQHFRLHLGLISRQCKWNVQELMIKNNNHKYLLWNIITDLTYLSVLAVDDRHVAFCEYNGSVARIICVAVATLANEKLLERASDNDLLLKL